MPSGRHRAPREESRAKLRLRALVTDDLAPPPLLVERGKASDPCPNCGWPQMSELGPAEDAQVTELAVT